MAETISRVIPTDPLFASQWHLYNTGQTSGGVAGFDINVTPVWGDYTGKGVLIAAIDDGFDETHPDLSANYRKDLSWDLVFNRAGATPVDADDDHGTAVSGLIIGSANNGIGGVGVAWNAQLIGYRSGLSGNTLAEAALAVPKMLANGVAISSNSWGTMDSPFDGQSKQADVTALTYSLASQGRGGLGIVTLFSAGNERNISSNTNYDVSDNTPFSIAVAASRVNGLIAGYSTPGATVLVTAPGSDPASIVSTDRQGSVGYNKAEGLAGNYTDTVASAFNGTSASAPIAAGVVALMLEANPRLGYRDVQEILVYSSKRAVFVGADGVESTYNGAKDWNGGGLLTGYDFGYGNIDALAAVRLAETWQKQNTTANLKLIDGTIATSQQKLVVADGASEIAKATFTASARVEQMTVTVDLSTTRLQDVKLELISPDGTISTLIDNPRPMDTDGQPAVLPTQLNYTLNTVRDWGESLSGTWLLKLTNGVSGEKVTLNNWSIKAYAADPVSPAQIFTNEFSFFSGQQAGRTVLSSANGTTLNAAAVTAASVLDLTGGASHIGGTAVSFTDPQAFTGLIAGDGNDILKGNALNNLLAGGRGNDIINGGAGIDIAAFTGTRADYQVHRTGTDWTVSRANWGVDLLSQVERLEFVSGGKLALDLAATEAAGLTMEFIGALAYSSIGDASTVGAVLPWFDQGKSMREVAQIVIDAGIVAQLAGSGSNTDLTKLLYRNIIGTEADSAAVDMMLGYMDGRVASYSQSEFISFAAGLEANQQHINLVGLQQTGVAYL